MNVRVLSQFDPSVARTNSIADLRLCAGLAAAGHRVTFVAPSTSSAAEAEGSDGVRTRYGLEPRIEVDYVRVRQSAGDRERTLALVAHHGARAATESASTALISRDVRLLVPYIAARRCVLPITWLHEFRNRPLERWVCARSASILATNSAILEQLTSSGLHPRRTFVTGNAVPVERLEFGRTFTKDEARRRIGLDTSKRVVVYTGKLYLGMRELDYLLEAARRLPDHLFLFTGGQPGVVHSLRGMGVENTRFDGLFERPEYIRYHQQAADVLVSYYSSVDHPDAHLNLPNKIAEYMTTGNPIVVADFPAVRDVLNEENALFVEPENVDALVTGIEASEGAAGRAARAQADVAAQTCESVGARLGTHLASIRAPAALVRPLRERNLASIISNEIIGLELNSFLERHFADCARGSLLDLGAGTKPYAEIYEPYFDTCTSVDVEHSPHDITGVDAIASADDLPFADESFDCVVCTEVLEHCRRPAKVMEEIARVLRPGRGRLFMTTPFLRPLHEMPHDYYRYTPSSLRDLAEGAGLSVEEILPRGDYLALALLTFQLPLTKLLQRFRAGRHYEYSNPLVRATIVAPQTAYLAFWRSARGRPRGRSARIQRKLNYYALGYVSTFRKDPGRAS